MLCFRRQNTYIYIYIYATTRRDGPYQIKVWLVYCTKLKVETTGLAETTEPVEQIKLHVATS